MMSSVVISRYVISGDCELSVINTLLHQDRDPNLGPISADLPLGRPKLTLGYRADELVWAGLMTGLHGPVLRFMRVDAQSECFLSPPAVGRNAHDLKTCGRLSFCVRRSYNANESAAHSRHCRECAALAFL